ncbi:MAG TPA: SOS response-associated peptidase, partial [Candidatus Brocadiales bacterium]|nr:SOS response-associated peptidase [Candidatus Brocadiales bacterium]
METNREKGNIETIMCGRFVMVSAIVTLANLFKVRIEDIFFDLKPNYNIAPGQDIVIVIKVQDKNRLILSRWGFIPSWSKDESTGYKMINARSETIAEKRVFKTAFEKSRCLIVADGFYEWRKEGKVKKPVFIRLKSGRPFAFAGLYNKWISPEGNEVTTSTIITTRANELLEPVHDRMPVITPEERQDLWLDSEVKVKSDLLSLLKPYPSEEMEYYDV